MKPPVIDRVSYPYEASPGDGWPDTQTFAELWAKRWTTSTGYYVDATVVSAVREGHHWRVTLDATRRTDVKAK